jgi:hypothetical protein
MRTLGRIWNDISHFENIDLYITVIVAVGLAIFNLLGIAPSSYIAPLTLAVLGLLGFTSLINRHRIDEIHEALSHSPSEFFMEEFPSDWKNNFDTANEVWLIGVSLHRTVNFNYEKIEKKLRQGHKFKIMVVSPEGPSIEMTMTRNYPRKDVGPRLAGIRNTLQLLCDLQKIGPGLLEVRTIEYPLSYGVIVTNPHTASGVMYLEHYTFGISTESLPRFIVRASDGKWYDFFKREIQAMWDYGVAWQSETSSSTERN